MTMHRRTFLRHMCAGGIATFGFPVVNFAQVASPRRFVFVLLRGGFDGLAAVVLGLPRRLSGESNEQTAAVEQLASHLRDRAGVPLVLQDERLTSREAESLLARREKDWRKRKPLVDALAAAVILQDYLDGLPRASAAGEFGS